MPGNRILIADDDPKLHSSLEEIFVLSGYEVFHAKNGVEGMMMMTSIKPDIVLIDIQMPVMDGFQMVQEIRKQSVYQHVYLMLMSSLNRDFLKRKGNDLGANDFIAKPFSGGELLARVNNAFRVFSKMPSEGILRGDLSNLGLAELLQSMELGSKTAVIFLEDPNAEIRIQEGSLVHVKQGGFSGREALVRIFLLERGAFSVKFTDIGTPVSGDFESITSLLMDILITLDELKEMIAEVNAGTKHLTINGDLSEFPEIEKCSSLFPTTLVHLIVNMKGEIKENIRLADIAIRQGKIGFMAE